MGEVYRLNDDSQEDGRDGAWNDVALRYTLPVLNSLVRG
jgi:hypothetical protein